MNKVAKYRKYMGFTQSDVAKIFGISLQAYSRKERMITSFSDEEKVVLKNIFKDEFPDITVGEIFFGEQVPKVEICVKRYGKEVK